MVCKICNTVLAYKSSTTVGKDHLKMKHNIKTDAAPPSAATQPSIFTSFASPAAMVYVDGLPLCFVEGEAFVKLMGHRFSGYDVPTRKTLTAHIEKLFAARYKQTEEDIRNQPAGNIHITHDGWTSAANVSYYVVTAHWLDENFFLQERVLSVRPISGHSGDEIQLDIEATIKEFLLVNPVATIDNCSAEVNGVCQAGLDVCSCFGHNNNRAAVAGLEEPAVKAAVATQRSICTYFHKSSTAKEIFMQAQVIIEFDYFSHI